MDILSRFLNIRKKETTVLGIDIGSSSIKAVQISLKDGHAVLDTYGELALGPYAGKSIGEATMLDNEKLIGALNDLLQEKEVNITTRACGIAIPFSSSFMSVIDLPIISQKQLADMVPIEARKYVPVPISEVSLDWSVIPKDNDASKQESIGPDGKPLIQRSEVLLVAIHNNVINKYKELVMRTGLDASFFEIEIFSTMRSLLDQETQPILLVDMGAASTKLYIIERAVLRLSHMINRGSQSITNEMSRSLGISVVDAEILKREKGLDGVANGIGLKDVMTITLNYIFNEANSFILNYQKRYNKNISKVVLVGGGSALKGIVGVAQKSFQTEVIQGDPFAKVVAPAFLEKILKETGPEFAVSVGVALRRLQESI